MSNLQGRAGRQYWNNNGPVPQVAEAPPLVTAPSRIREPHGSSPMPTGSPSALQSNDWNARQSFNGHGHERPPSFDDRPPGQRYLSQEYRPPHGREAYGHREESHHQYHLPPQRRVSYNNDYPCTPPYAASAVARTASRAGASHAAPPLVSPPGRDFASRTQVIPTRSRSPSVQRFKRGGPLTANPGDPIVCADLMFLNLAPEMQPKQLTHVIATLEGTVDVLEWSTSAYPVTIPTHPSGGCRGFGFAKFRSISAAERFMKAHGPIIVDGHYIAGVPALDGKGHTRRPMTVAPSQTDGPTRTIDPSDTPPLVVPPPPIVPRPSPLDSRSVSVERAVIKSEPHYYHDGDRSDSARNESYRHDFESGEHRSHLVYEHAQRGSLPLRRERNDIDNPALRRGGLDGLESRIELERRRSRSPVQRRWGEPMRQEQPFEHVQRPWNEPRSQETLLERHNDDADSARANAEKPQRKSMERGSRDRTGEELQRRRSMSPGQRTHRSGVERASGGSSMRGSHTSSNRMEREEGKYDAPFSLDSDARSKPKGPLATKKFVNDMSKWQTKQEELREAQPAAEPEKKQEAKATAVETVKTQSTREELISHDFDFTDSSRIACLLCNRQFKTMDTMRRHTIESDLHKRNLDDDSLRAAGVKRIRAAQQASASANASADSSLVAASSTPDLSIEDTSRYRDRAQERRAVFGESPQVDSQAVGKPRRFDGPPPLAPAASVNPIDASAPLDSSNKGSKMLAQMGWTAGAGLGAEGAGRTAPVDTIAYQPGVGLGMTKGQDAHAQASNADLPYAERMREAARKRLGT